MRKAILLLIMFPIFLHAQYVDYWTGKLSFGTSLTIELNVIYDGLNPDVITLDCPEQNNWETPCELVKWTLDSFNISLNAAGVMIFGKKTNHDSILDARWVQGGVEIPIVFSRSLTGIDPVRPQNPPLFVDYIVEDVRIHNSKDNVDLYGMLTIPKGYQMKGCAVLVSGSGPQDKEESIMGHKPFWVIAHYLTTNGYAVLRYDDRGSYRSSGDFEASTIYDFANDVKAVIDVAKERTGLDDSKIGLIGHSEGGMVSQIVLKDRPLGFFISLAGPAAPCKDLIYQQNRDLSSMMNISQSEFDKTVGPFLKKVLKIVADPKISRNDATLRLLKLYQNNRKKFSDATKKRFEVGGEMGTAYWLTDPMRVFIGFVPENYISQLKIPVLALNGNKDIQVNSKMNLDIFRKYDSNNALNDQIELEGKNHLFQTCSKCTIAEYGMLEESFSPEVLDLILKWLNKVFS